VQFSPTQLVPTQLTSAQRAPAQLALPQPAPAQLTPTHDRRPTAQRPGLFRPDVAGLVRPTGYVADSAGPRARAATPPTAAPPRPISRVPARRTIPAGTPTPSRPAVAPAGIGPSYATVPVARADRVCQRPGGLIGRLSDVFLGDEDADRSDDGAAAADEPTFDPRTTIKIPLARSLPPDAVQVDPRNGRVTIAVRDAPLDQVLGLLAEQQGLNVICSEDVTARISITIRDAPFDEALEAILSVAGYTARHQGGFLLITSVAGKGNALPQAQGRETRVFVLDYVSAADAHGVIEGLLSPVGQSFLVESDELDQRKTQEVVVVEDLLPYLARIDQVVRQLDVPPRQVLIEAHLMSVELEDDCLHGFDWSYIHKVHPALTLKTTGFADAKASPALIFDLETGDLTALIECLKTTTDAKTLASPKVFALNGQQARIQVGEQLGYTVVTTTQTSSMESVEFLEVGVILTVTPQITPDNCVLMKVKPVVSTGQINPDTKLPEEETTEVETSLILRDGHGIVIGGLIQEEDIEVQQKVPFVGDLWLVGRLFQRRQIDRKRTELIVTLIPHIVPYHPECYQREAEQFCRATTPIVHGPLLPYPRPFEPVFPDASQPPACLYRWQAGGPCDGRAWGPAAGTVEGGEGPVVGYGAPSEPLPPAYYQSEPDPLTMPPPDQALPGPIPAP